MYFYKKGERVTACIAQFDAMLDQGYEIATEKDWQNALDDEAKNEIENEIEMNQEWQIKDEIEMIKITRNEIYVLLENKFTTRTKIDAFLAYAKIENETEIESDDDLMEDYQLWLENEN